MIKLPQEQLIDLERTQLCGEHKERVTVVWHAKENCHTLRCAKGEYPDALVRNPTLSEAYRQGELVPEPISDNIRKRQRNRQAVAPSGEIKPELSLVPQTDLGTGQLLVPEVIKALVDYARRYDLDPERGHVCLFHGKPYITLDGYYFHAKQTNIPFSVKSRPLTDDERKTYQVSEGAHAWVAEVIKGAAAQSFIGLGIVTLEEMTAVSEKKPGQLRSPVVAAHPWLMAQKRAEWQAMRRGFPIGEERSETRDERKIPA